MLGDSTNVTPLSVPKKTKKRPVLLFCELNFETASGEVLSNALLSSNS